MTTTDRPDDNFLWAVLALALIFLVGTLAAGEGWTGAACISLVATVALLPEVGRRVRRALRRWKPS